jgi:aminopeptidase N
MRTRRLVAGALLLAFAVGALAALGWAVGRALWLRAQVLDSGGPLSPLQAAYDVRRYELDLRVDPERRALAGEGLVIVEARASLARFELDLDRRMRVTAVTVDGHPARFTQRRRRRQGKLFVELDPSWTSGERHAVRVAYGGRPKIAADPPWLDGFVWARARDGRPWVGVTVQGDGADLWWPTKDHPSDRPEEGMAIALTVPGGLVGLANGRRVEERTNGDGTVTSRWEVAYPISSYLVTINIGPYVAIEERYRGADGTLDHPMTFWALPENLPLARAMWRDAPAILAHFARLWGEFPFLADKIAAVDAPYTGMEHQTLVGYGDDFLVDPSGIDETLVHELAHEWWGNKIGVRDWDDFWIHEGFATYAEALHIEELLGAGRAREHLERLRLEIEHARPLVTGRPRTSAEAYQRDLYPKGAWVLASLRWQLGDELFFRALRRFADGPDGGSRLVDSAELAELVAAECACALDAFWEHYLRRAAPPRYRVERRESGEHDELALAWEDPALEIPLPVRIGGELQRVEMPEGRATVVLPRGTPAEVDTSGRLLAEPAAASAR